MNVPLGSGTHILEICELINGPMSWPSAATCCLSGRSIGPADLVIALRQLLCAKLLEISSELEKYRTLSP